MSLPASGSEIGYRFGGNGATPAFTGSVVDVKCLASDFKPKIGSKTRTKQAICNDEPVVTRITPTLQLDVTLEAPDTGWEFVDKVGYWIEFSASENGTIADRIFIGRISDWGPFITAGQDIGETITVKSENNF